MKKRLLINKVGELISRLVRLSSNEQFLTKMNDSSSLKISG